MAWDRNNANPMVAPIFNPNDLEIIKYSPPPSTLLFVEISEMAREVGMVTRCASKMIKSTPMNPTEPTAYPNLKKRIAPKIVEIAVKNTGAVPNFKDPLFINFYILATLPDYCIGAKK